MELAKELIRETGVKLLGGRQTCSTIRVMFTELPHRVTPMFRVCGSTGKKAMEITKELDGLNYVFWGGREGYETLLNTDMKLELDNLARFLHMAVDYAKEIDFNAQFLIEPKPKERPSINTILTPPRLSGS